MSKTSRTIRKMCVLAGMSVFAAMAAAAVPVDGQISIDRALNSPTLTVRYEGANAALVELRVNGESLGTRSMASAKSSGETNFTLKLAELKDGDNEVEVRLFDRTGKVIGTERTSISTDQTNYGPVFLRTPKMGATVTGPVEIDLGFGREFKNVFVSFFVDDNFKKMTNYPPYTMTWDTTGETNGWHEVEAWVIDESSTTFKTRKTRVFIDNPGGRTDRIGVADLEPTRPAIRPGDVIGAAKGVKPVTVGERGEMVNAPDHLVQPTSATGVPMANKLRVYVGGASSMKPTPNGEATTTGPRLITPTHLPALTAVGNPSHPYGQASKLAPMRVAQVDKGQISIVAHNFRQIVPTAHVAERVASTARAVAQAVPTVHAVENGITLVRITKGQRLPNLTSFEVVYNSAIVDFPDVQPRVDDGIPMTPFRYLFEKTGGTVDWAHLPKTVTAKGDGHEVSLRIGDKLATVNKLQVRMESAPYIDRGRTIVPLSFIDSALNVNVDYDKETGHVLISSRGNN